MSSDKAGATSEIPITVNLLSYNKFAANKYTKLSSKYNEMEMAEPSEEGLNQAISIFGRFGIDVEVGG